MTESEKETPIQVHINPVDFALQAPIKKPSAKLVLVSMAMHADERWQTHVSWPRLCVMASARKDTAQQHIRDLIKAGYLEDTGTYRYPTGEGRVYQIVQK